MSDTDVTALLRRATDGLTPPPDLLPAVRREGARRHRRRRVTTVLTAVALVVGGSAAVQVARGPAIDRTLDYAGADPFGPYVDGPTGGDLADDARYLRSVVQAWNRSHGDSDNRDRGIFDDLRGEPWVAWAGTTPAGRAALVAQRAFLHEHGNFQSDGAGLTTLLGFVGVDGEGRVEVVGDTYPAPGSGLTTAWFVDPARTVLAGLSEDRPLGLALGWTYRADGRATRQYDRLTDRGGVSVATGLAVGTDDSVAVSTLPNRGYDDLRFLANPATSGQFQDRRVFWQGTPADPFSPLLDLDATRACGEERRRSDIEALDKAWLTHVTDPNSSAGSIGTSTWHACGTLPDGQRVVLGEQQLDNDPSRLLALIGASTVVDLGPLDPTDDLPVVAELPGTWAVAAYGATLRARTGPDQAWSVPAQDACLFPLATTEVEVTRDGRSVVVALR